MLNAPLTPHSTSIGLFIHYTINRSAPNGHNSCVLNSLLAHDFRVFLISTSKVFLLLVLHHHTIFSFSTYPITCRCHSGSDTVALLTCNSISLFFASKKKPNSFSSVRVKFRRDLHSLALAARSRPAFPTTNSLLCEQYTHHSASPTFSQVALPTHSLFSSFRWSRKKRPFKSSTLLLCE